MWTEASPRCCPPAITAITTTQELERNSWETEYLLGLLRERADGMDMSLRAIDTRRWKHRHIGRRLDRVIRQHPARCGALLSVAEPVQRWFSQQRLPGVVVNTNSRSARLVQLDEGRVGYKDKSAQIAKGPWEVTFEHGRVIGRSDGPGRILLMTTPDGITELPELVVDGLPCAPGTWGKTGLLVPVMPGEHTFEVRVLKQPPVWRNCQAW